MALFGNNISEMGVVIQDFGHNFCSLFCYGYMLPHTFDFITARLRRWKHSYLHTLVGQDLIFQLLILYPLYHLQLSEYSP